MNVVYVDFAARRRFDDREAVRVVNQIQYDAAFRLGDGNEVGVLTDSGSYYAGFCPRHDDTEMSLNVYPDSETFLCDHCGAFGAATRLVVGAGGAA